MDYEKAKNKIESLNRFGSVLGLDNIYELLRRLDNPQDKVRVVHVAGTNGKGSTIAYISGILKEAGYRVGKYISPVVFEYLEKYQIDNVNISKEAFAALVSRTMEAVEAMVAEGRGQPTIFEVETAMAYLYFYEQKCDVAIIETGMGGDMDATNVCSKVLASIIVSVSLDHTEFLGDSLKEIAGHKAGIIKRGCPVILYGQSEEVTEVVRAQAESLGAPLIIAKGLEEYLVPFAYETANGERYEKLVPALKGVHQINNLCTALEAIEQLKGQGYSIPKAAVMAGIANTYWHGRFEKLGSNPLFIIDGAHNPDAVEKLRATILHEYPHTKWIFIMGVLADKDFAAETELLRGMAKAVITVTPGNSRALAAEELAGVVRASRVAENVSVASNVEEAVLRALALSESLEGDKGILAFGSLSYLGELKKCYNKYKFEA